jgi:hypothetical protein
VHMLPFNTSGHIFYLRIYLVNHSMSVHKEYSFSLGCIVFLSVFCQNSIGEHLGYFQSYVIKKNAAKT